MSEKLRSTSAWTSPTPTVPLSAIAQTYGVTVISSGACRAASNGFVDTGAVSWASAADEPTDIPPVRARTAHATVRTHRPS